MDVSSKSSTIEENARCPNRTSKYRTEGSADTAGTSARTVTPYSASYQNARERIAANKGYGLNVYRKLC